jgi:hypothetical protein
VSTNVRAEIDVYEKDDCGDWGKCEERITLKSHWNDRDAIVLVVGGHSYVVMQRALRDSIDAVAAVKPRSIT